MAVNSVFDDIDAPVNPHQLGLVIYKLVAQYFKDKYSLQVAEVNQKDRTAGPTITWRTLRRTPGGGGRTNAFSQRGPTYTNTQGVDSTGQVQETYTQFMQMTLEFSFTSTTRGVLNDVAWDWECVMQDMVAPLQEKMPGFLMVFEEEVAESSMSRRVQDELLSTNLRYSVVMPVRYHKIIPQLRQVQVNHVLTMAQRNTGKLIRDSSDQYYDLPVDSNLGMVTGILAIYKQSGLNPTTLTPGLDYQVVQSTDFSTRIKWLDSIGNTPEVGGAFSVTYKYAPGVLTHNVRGRGFSLPPVVQQEDQ